MSNYGPVGSGVSRKLRLEGWRAAASSDGQLQQRHALRAASRLVGSIPDGPSPGHRGLQEAPLLRQAVEARRFAARAFPTRPPSPVPCAGSPRGSCRMPGGLSVAGFPIRLTSSARTASPFWDSPQPARCWLSPPTFRDGETFARIGKGTPFPAPSCAVLAPQSVPVASRCHGCGRGPLGASGISGLSVWRQRIHPHGEVTVAQS